MTYTVIDLFCGAGGAAKGYADAGFEVIGVDINPQPRFPYEFIQADATDLYAWAWLLQVADAIHASPPCQAYSRTQTMNGRTYPALLPEMREILQEIGLPYVIENVPEAPLENPVILCGSHFGLAATWYPYGRVGLRRHRGFEASFPLPDPGPHDHSLRSVRVYGGGADGSNGELHGPGHAQAARDVMQVHWMRRDELNESVPPAYTEYIGTHLRQHLDTTSNRSAA